MSTSSSSFPGSQPGVSASLPGSAPVDPDTLPDPEDITEADLGEAPPRPGRERRNFGGTREQIRGATKFFKVCAYITGVMLIMLVVEMILKYGMGRELFAGGTTLEGESNVLSLQPIDSVIDGFNVSTAILITHGWMYVVYLLAGFRLWTLMRWEFPRLLVIAGGGVVPLLSFFVERSIHREVDEELHRFPEATRRY
ncbi:MAG: DUF3817 domain-containing protein [Micrococcus sp.]|nr:DUF3817 domain-containing protein [Micrococcus sp.]